jgi:hypothetical protein
MHVTWQNNVRNSVLVLRRSYRYLKMVAEVATLMLYCESSKYGRLYTWSCSAEFNPNSVAASQMDDMPWACGAENSIFAFRYFSDTLSLNLQVVSLKEVPKRTWSCLKNGRGGGGGGGGKEKVVR